MKATSFLSRHRLALTIALSAVIAVLAAVHARPAPVAAAATHVMIDSQPGLVSDKLATDLQFSTYAKEATLLGNLLASDPVRYIIARRMNINPALLTSRVRITGFGAGQLTDTVSETRANQIFVANRPYKVEVQPDPNLPLFAVYGQAPTATQAVAITNAAVAALSEYLAANPTLSGLGANQKVLIRQLGPANGALVNHQETLQGVVLAFFVAFGLACGGLLGFMRVRRGFLSASRRRADEDDAAASADAVTPRRLLAVGGDWPRTTRVMPWLTALFLVIIWLVPFNQIQLPVNLPFDLKFDRIVLPLLAAVWLLSIAADGPAAPRPRMTRIHVAFLIFVMVVGIGIVANSTALNQALEFNLSTKKLSLLLSYGMMFAIIASSVRRTEVPAFFKFSLILSVLCAAGSIYEYRFHYNVFYDLSSKILGKVFTVTPYNPNQIDELGRRMVRGPTDHPLELTGMLVMMFPVALVGILKSERRRDRVLYGLAACVLLAAAVSTDRKSALLAPLAVLLTVGYYYRGKLLRLAPLALVLVLAVHVLSPGALGTVVNQLNPSNLGVSTVSDRTADYDAVRPDVWSHLVLGRGYGTYDHLNYRTLDSDMLNRLIDIGVVGVGALVLMLGSIVTVARRIIRSKDPRGAPLALAVAAGTIGYFVLLFLFDVSSFPHVPYVLFSVAGLLAALETELPQPIETAVRVRAEGPRPAALQLIPRTPIWSPGRAFVYAVGKDGRPR